MLKVENLRIEYGELIFKNVNFLLGNNEKVGLVGLNGCGKSTLLKIITGEELPEVGEVHMPHERVGYLPQEFDLGTESMVGEFLEDLVDDHVADMWRVNKILSRLNWEDVDHFQEIHTLSPGQKMKLYLTRILIGEPTILLLDEPTNHLDIDGIIWFEGFIKKFKGIVIMISHDRMFLNSVTNRIFEIDERTLKVFEGNYDDYIVQKEAYIEDRAKMFHLQEMKRQKFEKLIENAKKIRDGRKRSKAVSSAKKRMEREVTRHEVKRYEEISVKNLDFSGDLHGRKRVLRVEGLCFDYSHQLDDRQPESDNNNCRPQDMPLLINNVNLEIYGKEKIWFIAPKVIGKSTLIKLLIGELNPIEGSIRWGENLKWEYFSQEQTHLPFKKSAIEYFVENTSVDYFSAYKAMDKFLFDRNLQEKKIGKLSPGQRARLSFAIFSQHKYDCLILDEPTNHLDIKTKEVVEESLRDFEGAIILISHDRYFSENLNPSRIVTLTEGALINV